MQGQQDEQGEGAQANGHAEAAGEGVREFMRPPPNRPTVSSEHHLLHYATAMIKSLSMSTLRSEANREVVPEGPSWSKACHCLWQGVEAWISVV